MALSPKDKRIRKEIKRLQGILGSGKQKNGEAGQPDPKIEAAKHLIENAAFMAVSLEDLRAEINEKGWTESYQNGANQSGVKKSAASECYTATYKNYLATVKQLIDIAPEGSAIDELTAFNL